MKLEESTLYPKIKEIADNLLNCNPEMFMADNKAAEINELCGDGDLRTITFYNKNNEECYVRIYKKFVVNMSFQTNFYQNMIEIGKMVKF